MVKRPCNTPRLATPQVLYSACSAFCIVLFALGAWCAAAPPGKAKKPATKPSSATVSAGPADVLSPRSVKAFVREVEESWLKKGGRGREARKRPASNKIARGSARAVEEEGAPGAEHWEAYLYYIQQRAFPFDRFDARVLVDGSAQRERMPRGRASDKAGEGVPGIGSFGVWSDIGPRGLDAPYRQYWGLEPVNGRVNAIAYDRLNPSTIYVGGSSGGVWKSEDAGARWTPVSNGWGRMNVASIATDPSDSKTLYVGTGDFHGGFGAPIGLLKSTDGGSSWAEVGQAQFGTRSERGPFIVSSILVDPEDSRTVTVTTWDFFYQQGGSVWRSTDAGASWAECIALQNQWVRVVAGALKDGKRKYFAVGANGTAAKGGALWYSTDRGADWSQLKPPLNVLTQYKALDCAASPTIPDRVYLLDCDDRQIFLSTDAGANWSSCKGNFPDGEKGYNWSQSTYDWHVHASSKATPDGPVDVVYVGLVDLVQSPDGGLTWTSIGQTYSEAAITHNDQHSLAVHPADPNVVLVGNDGGISRATYAPATGAVAWERLSQDLNIIEFYHGDWHPSDAGVALGGCQDNANPVLLRDPAHWLNKGAGDGTYSAINPVDPRIMYTTDYSRDIFRTGDEWKTTTMVQPQNAFGDDTCAFLFPIAIDPNQPVNLYAGTNYLWRLVDGSTEWTPRLGNRELASNGHSVRTLSVARGDSNRIYTGASDGQVWMTKDGGSSWSRLDRGSPALPKRTVTSIEADPSNPSDILVGLSGYSTTHLWRCGDTTADPAVWTSVAGSGATALPDVPLNTVCRDFLNPKTTWYAGTDVGVFMTTDAGSSWANVTFPYGLPNVGVNKLKMVPGTGYLNAATFGRGMWRIRAGPPGMYDLNQDWAVNAADMVLMAAVLGDSAQAPCGSPCTDVNMDGRVDALDLMVVQRVLVGGF